MKLSGLLLAALAAVSLSSCAKVQADFQGVVNTLSSPQATQAAQNIVTITTAITCTVPRILSTTQLITQLGGNSKKNLIAVRDEQTACVASVIACNALGGSATVAPCTASVAGVQ